MLANYSKNDIPAQLCENLYKFQTTGLFCQLELNISGYSRTIHSAVFAAHSRKFYRSCSEPDREPLKRYYIDCDDITEVQFDMLLKFLYTGSTDNWDLSVCNVFSRIAINEECDLLAVACKTISTCCPGVKVIKISSYDELMSVMAKSKSPQSPVTPRFKISAPQSSPKDTVYDAVQDVGPSLIKDDLEDANESTSTDGANEPSTVPSTKPKSSKITLQLITDLVKRETAKLKAKSSAKPAIDEPKVEDSVIKQEKADDLFPCVGGDENVIDDDDDDFMNESHDTSDVLEEKDVTAASGVSECYEMPKKEYNLHCNLCKQTFSDKSKLWQHIQSMHPDLQAKCNNCLANLDSEWEFVNHECKFNADPESSTFSCVICESKFAIHDDLANHHNSAHPDHDYLRVVSRKPDSKESTCWWCGDSFSSRRQHWYHHESNHEGKDLQCNQCLLVFNSKHAFIWHFERKNCKWNPESKEASAYSFKCPDCYLIADEQAKLLIHWRLQHAPWRVHTCDICHNVTFIRIEEYAEHLWTEHDRLEISGIFKFLSYYQCQCDEKFVTFNSSTAEQHAHACNKDIWYYNDLMNERKVMDFSQRKSIFPKRGSGRRPIVISKHQCLMCSILFSTSYDLEFHLFKKHDQIETGRGIKKCKSCAFTTAYSEHMETHRLREHEIKKGLYCQMCSLHFDEKVAYLKHIEIHGMYKCEICPYLTESYGSLSRHMNVVHNMAKKRTKSTGSKESTKGGPSPVGTALYTKTIFRKEVTKDLAKAELKTPKAAKTKSPGNKIVISVSPRKSPQVDQPEQPAAEENAIKTRKMLTIRVPMQNMEETIEEGHIDKLIEAARFAEKRCEFDQRFIPRVVDPKPNTSKTERETSAAIPPPTEEEQNEEASKKRSRHSKKKSKTPLKRAKYSCHLCSYTCDKQETLFKHFERCQKNFKVKSSGNS